MKRSMTLLLPLLLVLASCGTTAQYSQQRYQDGIYFKTTAEPEEVVILSKEDFQRLAAQNIRQQALEEALDDSTKVSYELVYPGDYYYDMYFSPFPTIALWAGSNLAFTSWYWDRWHNWWGPFGPMGPYDTLWFDYNRPYFGWGTWGWYDPWYYGYGWRYSYFDPWYGPFWYDPWYYPGYYRPYGPFYPGGGGFIRDVSYGPRYQTQPVGSRTVQPGSGASVRRSGTSGYGNRGYVGTRSTNGTVTRISPSGTSGVSDAYNRRAVRPSTSSSSGSSSTYGRGTNSSSSRSYTRSSSGSSSTYSRSSSSSSSSSRSVSPSSSSSRSYSSGSSSSYSSGGSSRGGGGYSGGGSSSHSGGGGGSHGGRR